MKRLLRFYGFRYLAALLASIVLSRLALSWFGSTPPEHWSEWPFRASTALTGLTAGLLAVAFCGWVYLLLRPLLFRPGWTGHAAQFGLCVVVLTQLPDLWKCFVGGYYLAHVESGGTWPVLREVWRVVGWPLLLGTAPLWLLELYEYVQVNPHLRRWLLGGRGHIATWIRPAELRKFIRPLPNTALEGIGHLGHGIYVGRTLFEDDGLGRQHVWINDNAHGVTCAMTSSGKFTTDLALNGIFHTGSAIYISPKPELADFLLGRRVDPEIFSLPNAKQLALGVNPKGITNCRFHIPNSRSFALDFSGQSAYASSRYGFLSDIDIRQDNARSLLLAVASGSFPDRPANSTTDPWFTNTPRGFLAAGCAHVMTTDPDKSHHTLPYCVERLMGIDPNTGVASVKYFEAFLKAMMRNNALDGFVQCAASNIFQLGEKAFGNLNSELETNCRWITDGPMRRHLSTSDFSFHWVGRDDYPVTLFVIPARGRAAFQASVPWLRTLSELGLEILSTKTKLPKIPTLFVGDEYRQWGEQVAAVKNGFSILRDKKVKLWLYVQSFAQLLEMFGEHGAAEIESSCTMKYFGCNDLQTAERISRRLGKLTLSERQGWLRQHKTKREVDVITPAEVMQELRLTSNLQYVFPAGSLPLRLERVAFKPLCLNDGGRFAGLPLEGHYDEFLTKQSRGRAAS